MKKYTIIYVLFGILIISSTGASQQNQSLFRDTNSKIYITAFEKKSGGEQYNFLKTALPRSIAVTFNRTYKTQFGEQAAGNEVLINQGYHFLITGSYAIQQRELVVSFEIRDLKRNMVIIEANAAGSADGRQIFNLIDRISGILVVVSIPSAAMNQKIKISIDKTGKITTTLGGFVGTDLRGIDFSGQDLSNRDFTAANLEGANFRNSILTNTNFSRANLKNTVFTGAAASGTNFSGAILPSIDFSKTKFSKPIFSGAILNNTNFSGADLTGAHFERSVLSQANLSGVTLVSANMKLAQLKNVNLSKANVKGVNFYEADMANVNLEGADLAKAKMTGKNLKNVNLSSSNCTGTDFSNSILVNANLSRSNLSEALFLSANLNKANLNAANLTGTQFSDANIVEADFTNAQFNNTDFSGAMLNGSKMMKLKLTTVNFQRSSMQNVDLTGSDISNVNLSNVNLTAAIMENATAIKTNFESANLHNAKLIKADLTEANFNRINGSYGGFQNTILRKTVFTEADLRYADFTGAVYGEATYLGANIKNAKFSGEPPETHVSKFNLLGLGLTGNFTQYKGALNINATNSSVAQNIGFNVSFRSMIFGNQKNTTGLFIDAGFDYFTISESGDVLGVPYSDSVKISYLSLSVGPVFKINNLVILFVAPFAQYGLKLASTSSQHFRRFNFGGTLGLGFITKMSPNAVYYLGLEFKFQILPILEDSNLSSAKLISIGLNMSFLFY